ncbi:MAG: DUF6544 family protein [Bacteroidales bacterium]
MKKEFLDEYKEGLKRNMNYPSTPLTEKDMESLPEAVKNYLRYTGCVGKERINNVVINFDGQLRSSPSGKWMQLKVRQASFFDLPTRLFYIRASMMGIPARGLHFYKNANASMRIKVLSLFPIIDEKGPVMDRSETVTFFNDMCLLAPATLLDPAIEWTVKDSLIVNGRFTVNGITVSADLYFNKEGQLINFISTDRACYAGKGNYRYAPWSTPVKEYGSFSGRCIPIEAEAIWQFPEGDFCYGIFKVKELQYNLNK